MRRSYYMLVIFTFCCLLSCQQTSKNELPVYNPSDFNPALVDISLHQKAKDHTVSDFELINQNGEIITQKDYEDTLYIVDFFFTRCPTICPVMTNNIGKLQTEFLFNTQVKFLSISVTPAIDSVPILKQYAIDKGVIDTKWNITTGNKKHIYELARKSYFAVVEQGDGGLQDFIHTPNFILVDKKKQIRGIYNGTEEKEISRLINDIKSLSPNQKPENLVNFLDVIWQSEQTPISLRDSLMRIYGAESKEYLTQQRIYEENHRINEKKIMTLLDNYGWPSEEMAGEQGNFTISNVLQHADHEIRIKYLPMMRKAVKEKILEPRFLVRTEDRIATEKDELQLYGGQMKYYPDTKSFNLWPVFDPANIDKRRIAIGLDSIASFLRERFDFEWNLEEQIKRSEKFEQDKQLKNK